jgi:hypothetical protein
MKQLIFVLCIFIFLSSCKKDYTCMCTNNYYSGPFPVTVEAATKFKAKAICEVDVEFEWDAECELQ